jgi:hypothetical protein
MDSSDSKTRRSRSNKPAGGSRLIRSETVTVRLDPKLRYLSELAARKQRRTLSSYIEWALEQSLSKVNLTDSMDFNGEKSIADVASLLWDVDEADRFVELAFNYPELMTHEEQVLWKLVRENGFLWRGTRNNPDKEWSWQTNKQSSLIGERLREHWDTFNAVARGEKNRSALPTWNKTLPSPPSSGSPNSTDPDDEIPF